MAGGASRPAPWAKRFAIAGALFLVFGAFLINSQNEAIDSIHDPRVVAIAENDGSGTSNFEVEKGGCYMAVVKQSAPSIEVTLTPIVGGSAAATESLSPSSCFSDWAPMASDATSFIIHEQWVTEESGEMTVSSSCSSEPCESYAVWVVHIEDTWVAEYLEYTGLIFGGVICCLGLILLPVAGLIAYSARSNALHGTIKVIDNDGTLLQSYESQEELMAALKDTNSPLYQGAGSDIPQDNIEQEDGFVDGSRDVMQGTMMTTEQVYGFMRGEIPEAVESVEDPFVDSPTPVRQTVKKKVDNTSVISDWDMGGSNDEQKITPRAKPTQIKEVKEKNPESNDWSVWDDM